MTRPNSTQTTSTQNPRQTSTQTGPLNFSTTQPAKEEDCQCEDNKSIQPFQSNFARQLHERRRNQEIRMQREIAVRPQQQQQQQQQQAISHAPQQQQQQQHVPQQAITPKHAIYHVPQQGL